MITHSAWALARRFDAMGCYGRTGVSSLGGSANSQGSRKGILLRLLYSRTSEKSFRLNEFIRKLHRFHEFRGIDPTVLSAPKNRRIRHPQKMRVRMHRQSRFILGVGK
jgi:hypothetical protein